MQTTVKTTAQEIANLIDSSDQLNLSNLISGRRYSRFAGWEDINISPEAKNQLLQMAVETIGGRDNTKAEILWNLKNTEVKTFGILERVIFEKRGDKYICTYIAGQHGPTELAIIRKELRK